MRRGKKGLNKPAPFGFVAQRRDYGLRVDRKGTFGSETIGGRYQKSRWIILLAQDSGLEPFRGKMRVVGYFYGNGRACRPGASFLFPYSPSLSIYLRISSFFVSSSTLFRSFHILIQLLLNRSSILANWRGLPDTSFKNFSLDRSYFCFCLFQFTGRNY